MKLETIKKIVEEVTQQDISTKRRFRELVNARAIYYKLARDYTGKPLAEIARVVKKNHATVLHSINSIEAWVEHDKALKSILMKSTSALELALTDDDTEFMAYEKLIKRYSDLRTDNINLTDLNQQLAEENKDLKNMLKKYGINK